LVDKSGSVLEHWQIFPIADGKKIAHLQERIYEFERNRGNDVTRLTYAKKSVKPLIYKLLKMRYSKRAKGGGLNFHTSDFWVLAT